MPATHRLGEQVTAHSSCRVCGHGRSKEKPSVRAVAGAGALDRNGSPYRSACLDERRHIFLPPTFVEVNREEPTGLIFEERVDAHDVPTLQMFDEKLIAHRDKILIRTVAALAFAFPLVLEQTTRLPFVETLWSVARFPGFLAHEPHRAHIRVAGK